VLAEHHRHAYVLTRGVTASGMPLAPSADFLAVRDATARPADPRLARAWDLLQPLNDTLVQAGIGREDVLCAAVFTTESVSADLAAARAALYKEPAPAAAPAYVFAAAPMAGDDGSLDDLMGKPAAAQPGLDNPGGVTHANLAFVVQGSFVAPDFLAATQPVAGPTGATASQLGHITDASGAPMIQGHATIPFTLALPAGLASLANVPLVIVGHGIGGDRTAVLAVADTFAQKGLATLGIDFPFHGLRNPSATDLVHNLGCTNAGCRMGPDGFAESTTTAFLLFTDIMGGKGVPPLDPDAIGSTWRQAALDLMATVRLAADGSFAALATKDPRLAGLSFAGDSLGYTGSSLASIIGTLMLSVEPRVKGAALSVGGGGIVFPLVTWSPEYRGQLEPLLENSIGIPASTDPVESDFGHNLFQFLLERGDPLASAPLVASRPVHLLLAEAFHDETVPNAANEALAQALLLGYAQTTTGGTPQFAFTDPAPATVPKAPQSANRTVQEQPVTALFFQMQE
ncbi:MAG TPA: hypothetical protein VKW77_11145, partial [Acidimicrobiales bacterium]|nr:hypothetical protein [Acidimicrobiales bacterium]